MKQLLPLILLAAAAPASAQERPVQLTSEARAAMAEFGACVAGRSQAKAHETLTSDFTTRSYGRSLRALSDNNRDCMKRRGVMRASGLPFAAAIAEALLARGDTPLNVRLARAASTEPATFAPSDRVAMCVARSDANNSAALLTAPIASQAEEAAAQALAIAVARCTPAGVSVDLAPYALRSVLATASYRLLAAAGEVQ